MKPRPMVDRLGFPTETHPESMLHELPPADESWLAAVAAGLWPADEYAALIVEHSRRIGGQQ